MSIDEAINRLRSYEIINSMREKEQLAEWLEELKSYRASVFSGDMTRKMLKEAYNKAIDDFVKYASDMPIVEEEDGEYRPMWLEEMAEQLKAGIEDEKEKRM